MRKHLIFSMAFTPTSTSLPSSFSAALTANDMFMGFELEVNSINQAIEEAKEQLHQALEMKQEEAMQQWMKKSWEEWMSERDSVFALVDRKLVREAVKHTVVEIWKRWLKVSVSFSSILIFRS